MCNRDLINFIKMASNDLLVQFLTAHRNNEENFEILKRMKYHLNKDNGQWRFSFYPIENCIIIEDWYKYYNDDAAQEYDNPSEYVVECIRNEVLNKLEEEAYIEDVENAKKAYVEHLEKVIEEEIRYGQQYCYD